MEGVKLDMWGYEVRTSSDSCISAINSYYHQVCLFLFLSWCLTWFLFWNGLWFMDDIKVLSYGRERSVILEALVHDKDCVLANILAASFLCSSDPSRAPSHIQAAKSLLVSLLFWLDMGTWPFFVFTSFFFWVLSEISLFCTRSKRPSTRKLFLML